MPSTHPVEDELSALVDGELVGRRRRLTAMHVMSCGGCSQLCGELLAARRSMEDPELEAAAPERLWPQVSKALDTVDDLRAAMRLPQTPRQRMRLRYLTVAGAALIVFTLVARQLVLAPTERTEALVVAHDAAVATLTQGATSVEYDPQQAPAPIGAWRPLGSGLVRLQGALVEHIVWGVGPVAVSEFTLPASAFHPEDFEEVVAWGGPFHVGVFGHGSIVAWREYDHWEALVAKVPLDQLLQLARLRAAALAIP
jgi:hypothetical protein